MIKIKKYRAKQYPLFAISLYKNRQGTLGIQITSNIPDGTEPFLHEPMNMKLFGEYIAETDLLTKGDLFAICSMFQSYIDTLERKNYKPNTQ